jgi:hypothetical protein
MYGYDVDMTDTKQQRAMTKMMDRSGPRPATYSTRHTIRIDGAEELKAFADKHDFITHVISYDGDSFDVEYME